MKNSIKILFLLLITVAALCLASCGNSDIELPNGSDVEQNEENAEGDDAELEGEVPSECKHEYEEKVLIPATCQKEGITKKTCKLCKESENIITAKSAHIEVEDKGIPPTCTSAGISDGKHCSVCNAVTKKQEVVAALGHVEVIDPAVPATCTVPGKTEGKHCKVCNTILVVQQPTTAEHTIIKRTRDPLTCTKNGVIETYCTECERAIDTITIPKGHYSVDHEYAQITHPEIGKLCEGFEDGDKCLQCDTCFIAPGTYTIIGNIFKNYWTGEEAFSFNYLGGDGKKYSANKFKITNSGDSYNYLKFDNTEIEIFDSCIITITEPYFAEVSSDFYDSVFLRFFEKGEYVLSGTYSFNDRMNDSGILSAPRGVQNLKFEYSAYNLFDDDTWKNYNSEFIQIIETTDGVQMNYSNTGNIASFSYQVEGGYFNDDISRFVWLTTSQSVSKEFFEWFTMVADKYDPNFE